MQNRSLEEQRKEFSRRRMIATPIAGVLAWSVVAISSLFMSPYNVSILLFIVTGMIVYLGMFISRFTGENFLAKDKPKNAFDGLFFYSVATALLVYAIAIPFYLQDYTSLPLTVGILTGLMWLPFSWIIQHWIGLVHALARTLSVVIVWYVFPENRFFAVPLVIVLLYIPVIAFLECRWRGLNKLGAE
ncbi:MAG TPA: hypothetical protein VN030_10465 [Cellvibrio sp.]|nr:hypothetical protein [Cellvibrio sp.]